MFNADIDSPDTMKKLRRRDPDLAREISKGKFKVLDDNHGDDLDPLAAYNKKLVQNIYKGYKKPNNLVKGFRRKGATEKLLVEDMKQNEARLMAEAAYGEVL